MAITVKEAQTLYVSYFGRPADFVGLQYWTGTETLVGSLEQLAHSFYNSAEGKKYFPVDPATNQVDVTASINAIYANMFGRVPETAGFDYWYNEIASGKINPAEAAVAIYRGAQGKDALMIENKIAAATQFTDQVAASDKPSLYYGDQAFAKANEFLNTVTDVTDVTSTGFAAQVNAAVNAAEAAGGASAEGGIFKLNIDATPDSNGGTLTNEANVGFTPEGKYLTAGNDVIDLSEWTGSGNVTIGDAFSNDNDKVSVLAKPLSTGATGTGELKLTAVENLEIISSEPSSVILNGANFKGLEAIKLIGESTTLDVSNNFTYGIKVDATANADTITGSDKADTINGGAGNDVITGNGGVDILTGGNGADEFVVGTVRDAGVDQILDFSAEDKITMKGFSAQNLKKFDASTFSTVTYKTLDSVLATFAAGGANVTKDGDVVIFSYDGKTYALLANSAFDERNDALVDITGANVASLTESNFGTNGTFANYAAFKAAVLAGEVSSTSPVTIKSITAYDAADLLTTDGSNLAYIDDNGIGAVTGGPVNVTMTGTGLNTTIFANKLGAGVLNSALNINITGIANAANKITSSFGGKITGGTTGTDTIDASAATDAVTIIGSGGTDSITGGSGHDVLTGGNGADTIIGGAGNDTITSGGGTDSITGGKGNDVINLASGSAQKVNLVDVTSAADADTVYTFTTSEDKVLIKNTSGTTAAAVTALKTVSDKGDLTATMILADTTANLGSNFASVGDLSDKFTNGGFVYNTTTGALYYDADGNFTDGNTVLIGTFYSTAKGGANTVVTMAAGDFVFTDPV